MSGDEGSFSSGEGGQEMQVHDLKSGFHGGGSSNAATALPPIPPPKRKRNLPGTPGLFVHVWYMNSYT